MAHKTFISYKYSESRELRDKIIKALGEDATYYKGENVDSKDMTDFKRETIKKNLADMMYGTSVTIVILSPDMRESEWIGWEVSYCLKKIKRKDRESQRNGVVAVIKKVNGSYSWFKYSEDGSTKYCMNKIQDIIADNHFNSKPPITTNKGLYDRRKSSDGYWFLQNCRNAQQRGRRKELQVGRREQRVVLRSRTQVGNGNLDDRMGRKAVLV